MCVYDEASSAPLLPDRLREQQAHTVSQSHCASLPVVSCFSVDEQWSQCSSDTGSVGVGGFSVGIKATDFTRVADRSLVYGRCYPDVPKAVERVCSHVWFSCLGLPTMSWVGFVPETTCIVLRVKPDEHLFVRMWLVLCGDRASCGSDDACARTLTAVEKGLPCGPSECEHGRNATAGCGFFSLYIERHGEDPHFLR